MDSVHRLRDGRADVSVAPIVMLTLFLSELIESDIDFLCLL